MAYGTYVTRKETRKKKKERIRKGCTDTRAPRVQDQSKLDLFGKVECAACVQKTDLFVGLCYLAKENLSNAEVEKDMSTTSVNERGASFYEAA